MDNQGKDTRSELSRWASIVRVVCCRRLASFSPGVPCCAHVGNAPFVPHEDDIVPMLIGSMAAFLYYAIL